MSVSVIAYASPLRDPEMYSTGVDESQRPPSAFAQKLHAVV